MTDAALAICPMLTEILEAPAGGPPGPTTRQLALACVSQLAVACGPQRPKPILAMVPALLAVMSQEASPRALQCAALASLAHVIGFLGRQAVPALPVAVPQLLKGAASILFRLPLSDPASLTGASPFPPLPAAAHFFFLLPFYTAEAMTGMHTSESRAPP